MGTALFPFDKNVGWIYEFEYEGDPEIVIGKILSVVNQLKAYSDETWPTDEEWKKLLPKWIIDACVFLSQEEAKNLLEYTPREHWHELPWDFGSWLAAIRSRGWDWHSYKVLNHKIFVGLTLFEWPASLETFEWIVQSAGVKGIKGHFREI